MIHATATARSPSRVHAVHNVGTTSATNRTPTSRTRCSLYGPPVAATQPRPAGKSSKKDRGDIEACKPAGSMNNAISASGQFTGVRELRGRWATSSPSCIADAMSANASERQGARRYVGPLPVGSSLFGTDGTTRTSFGRAPTFEQATQIRVAPQLLPSIGGDEQPPSDCRNEPRRTVPGAAVGPSRTWRETVRRRRHALAHTRTSVPAHSPQVRHLRSIEPGFAPDRTSQDGTLPTTVRTEPPARRCGHRRPSRSTMPSDEARGRATYCRSRTGATLPDVALMDVANPLELQVRTVVLNDSSVTVTRATDPDASPGHGTNRAKMSTWWARSSCGTQRSPGSAHKC